jgi:RNA polymerase sigma-70 factor (ECF subfamily)
MARPPSEARQDFPTTSWTSIRAAGAAAAPGGREALDELLRRYWPALWAHLVYRKNVPPDRADDLVQSFIQEKILQRNLLQVADPARGKFRTFLLTALDRFAIDRWRQEAATLPAAERLATTDAEEPADVAGVAWAMQVLIESVKGMRHECEAKQRPDLWGIFAGRALSVLGGAEPLSFRVLADRFGMPLDMQAANRYHTALAMFRRHLHTELTDYADDDLESELAELRTSLSCAGPELLDQLRIHLWNDVPEVTMSSGDQTHIVPAALARLLELPGPASSAALLDHALTMPVPLDVAVDASAVDQARAGADELGLKTIGDLLHHPRPRPELLELVKDFAKDNRTDPESPLGREVATVLYYAAIAVALTRCDRRISRHDDNTLRQGFRWGSDQPWVDEATRELFRAALRRLGAAPGHG